MLAYESSHFVPLTYHLSSWPPTRSVRDGPTRSLVPLYVQTPGNGPTRGVISLAVLTRGYYGDGRRREEWPLIPLEVEGALLPAPFSRYTPLTSLSSDYLCP
eukprot:179265-Rhodomonas_salina.2